MKPAETRQTYVVTRRVVVIETFELEAIGENHAIRRARRIIGNGELVPKITTVVQRGHLKLEEK